VKSVLSALSSASGRRDEKFNKQLAQKIIQKKDAGAVTELVSNLNNKDSHIQGDCIKTLYEIGEVEPTLLKDHIKQFVGLLQHKNNRMVWGGMSALARIAFAEPGSVYKYLPVILQAAENGSVITKDNAVKILVAIAKLKNHNEEAAILLLEQVRFAPVNQFPSYAEATAAVVKGESKRNLKQILVSRLKELTAFPAKTRRIEKLMKELA
jgi:hypothetical protein